MSEELKIDPKDTREEVYEVPINPPKDPPGGFPPLKDFTPGKKYVIFKEVTNNGLPREIGVLYMVKDDKGVVRSISHHYFNPPPKMDPKFGTSDEPVVNVRLLHDELEEKNKLTDSGIPDIVFDFHQLLRDREDFKTLCGVTSRRKLSLVAVNTMAAKVRALSKLAGEMSKELNSMMFELQDVEEDE